MSRMEKAEQAIAKLYGDTAGALRQSDPEFAAIKERLIYGEIYAEERLDAGLRELLILVVAVTNQTMHEVRRHVRAALRCGVPPQQIREAVYQCAPYIGLGKTEAAVEAASETLADSGIPLPLPSGYTVEELSLIHISATWLPGRISHISMPCRQQATGSVIAPCWNEVPSPSG